MRVYLLTCPGHFGRPTTKDFFEGRRELVENTEIQSRGNNIEEKKRIESGQSTSCVPS